ncbi:hypothetical protein CYLTODRAFT_419600 [Cylindrobasidium torrendii FP15055 ss-10]|uniref:cAMP-independent regulatory protein pac2 n=1 Tax=Cylindrobasidium torrendii FP15055 ss-10 TaxID=1314674 RepID=A0A0D7BM15_9AGAR|nr:hypothetical protein CYLTODRAFT_419600 [Cylindrobasidium torrendii FP15055 ss-10]
MQTPTCTNVRIRSLQDVHKIFAAVQRGWLRMITKRLDADERMALCSGNIYVWEERGQNSEVTGLGMERFTEGRRWSPSRVRDEFLFYREMHTDNNSQPARGWEPLIKQTYSALVQTERGTRKWHLTAYFTESTLDSLGTIDAISGLKELVVPEGTYVSQKSTKARNTTSQKKKKKSAVTRTYAGFPPSTSMLQAQGSSQPVHMFDPYAPRRASDASQDPSSSQDAAGQGSSSSAAPIIPPPQVVQSMAHATDYGQTRYGSYESPTMPPPPPFSLSAPRPQHPSTPLMTSPHIHTGGSGQAYSPYMSPASYPSPGSSSGSSSSHSSSMHDRPSPVTYMASTRQMAASGQWFAADPEPSVDAASYDAYPSHAPYPYSDTRSSYHNPATSAPTATTTTTTTYTYDLQQPQQTVYAATAAEGAYNEFQGPPSPVSDDGQTQWLARGQIGPSRDLAPLHLLQRTHPYRRDPMDDKALRKLETP